MTMHDRLDRWTITRNTTIAAVPAVQGEDVFLELLRQVQQAYVRLTDAETLRMADLACSGHPEQQAFARDMLARNAGPVALEAAFEFSTRFGGLLEAFDGTLHLLAKLLPKVTETEGGKTRRTGWDGKANGLRWLTWVACKLPAELPMAAERLVDEKRARNAPAAIASGRSRLLACVGNDAELRDEFIWQGVTWKATATPGLPKGRKNQVVKKGGLRRITTTYLARGVQGKSVFPHQMPELRSTILPLTPQWVAAAVRANARAILRRPRISETTRRDAANLACATELWVTRNAKAHRLDALVGEDGDERLADIITVEAAVQGRFEAPLHRIDQMRALAAYRKYGPVHGEVLTHLPVRELLPVHRTRKRERDLRERFTAFCDRYGVLDRAHDVVAAGRYALTLTGTALDADMADVRDALRGVQAALRGSRPVSQPSVLGAALQGALKGTALEGASKDDVKVARQVQQAFPGLSLRVPLAAAVLFGRKLAKQGKADRVFVEACRKAGVRIRHAEDALELLKDVPVTSRQGARVRVQGAKGYVRPMQIALEASALSTGARADTARQAVVRLEREVMNAERAVDEVPEAHWVKALDHLADVRAQLHTAARVSDTLTGAAEALEDSCADLNLSRALAALVDADLVLDDHMAVQNPLAWWADAYWALDKRPVGTADLACPF
jgi:hypothetical protein